MPARLRPALTAGVLLLAAAASAQPGAAPGGPTPPPDSLSGAATASLLTMLPGEEIYALFGHSALRLHDPETGLDRTYNYGTFDFRRPYFALRFARGRLDYILATAPFHDEVAYYEWLRRPMIEQRLTLDAATVRELYRLLETNALPENRAFRYKFFYDNCSTRLLDVVDAALADAGHPRVRLPSGAPDDSFRDLLRPYLVADPWLWTMMSLGLGTPADATASTRQRSFLPLELMRLFDAATAGGRPLVASRDTVFWVPDAGMPDPAFPWPAAAAWGLFALGLLGTFLGAHGPPPRLVRVLDSLLLGAAGFAGLVFALLWFATEHGVTGPNLHVLWAWPTHLAAAVGVARGRPWRRYLLAAAGAAGLFAIAWPFLPQGMPPAAFPIVLLICLRCFTRGRMVD